jgi:hypothetical protein
MYCPSCGTESALDLNYCNRCGANMTAAMAPQQIVTTNITKPVLVIGLLTTILTIGGFGVLAIGAYNLARVFTHPDPIMALMMFGMATIMVSDIMLIRLLSRIVRSSLEPRPIVQPLRLQQTSEPLRQLSPRLEPISSVTDHTTRTFSPAYREAADRGTK